MSRVVYILFLIGVGLFLYSEARASIDRMSLRRDAADPYAGNFER